MCPQSTLPNTTCAQCGAPIRKSPSLLRERNFCNLACLGKYRSAHLTGPRAAHWRGGVIMRSGRVMLHRPDHPNANNHGYIYRYRLVAEETLGRYLQPGEIVHHIDGNETNDVPENLLVMSQAEHASRYDARRPVRGVIPECCGHGHALTPDNLYIHQRNGLLKWTCKTCRRAAGRRHDAKRGSWRKQRA